MSAPAHQDMFKQYPQVHQVAAPAVVNDPMGLLPDHDDEQFGLSNVSFAERANKSLALSSGVTVIPAPAMTKVTKVGTTRRSRNLEQIERWNQDPSQNCCVCASYDDGGLWFLDDDLGTLATTINAETGHDISIYHRVKTADGDHYYFLHDSLSRAVRYGTKENSGVIEVPGYKGEARCNGQYVMSALSVHPTGFIYQEENCAPVVPAPAWLLDWLKQKHTLSEPLKHGAKKSNSESPTAMSASQTQKPSTTGVVIGKEPPNPAFKNLFDAVGYAPLARRIGSELVPGAVIPCPMPEHKHKDYTPCFGPLATAPELLNCLGNCGFCGDLVKAVYTFDGGDAKYETMYDCARAICAEEGKRFEQFFPPTIVTPVSEIGDEKKRIEAAFTKALSTIDLVEPRVTIQNTMEDLRRIQTFDASFPKPLTSKSLWGILGSFVDIALPTTAASPEMLLYQMLPIMGAYLGKKWFVPFGSDRHYPSINALAIGQTADGKGQASHHVRGAMNAVDSYWEKRSIKQNPSSGEALVRLAAGTGLVGTTRLALQINEMKNLFDAMNREGSTLSGQLRNVYDGDPIENERSDKKKSVVATDYIIGILGTITPRELREVMQAINWANGVANRFLWSIAMRSKTLKTSRIIPNFKGWAERVKAITDLDSQISEMPFDYSIEGLEVWDAWVKDYQKTMMTISDLAKPALSLTAYE